MNTTGKYSDLRSFDYRFGDLSKRLEDYMQKSKAYTIQGLSLKELAASLMTNQTYLSQLLNKKYKTSFNDYLNKLRVEEACRLMTKGDINDIDMEHIRGISGFNSRATFYNSFRKFTGLGPAGFLKSYMRKQKIIKELTNMKV